MKSKKNLILIGMMGSGKSTIGQLLAKKLSFEFFDIDFIIENEEKMKISEIFKKYGENYFRNIEEKITIEHLNKSNAVVSLGGGAFINEIVREEITKNSIAFWLYWNEKTLINRIRKNIHRPIPLKLDNNELKKLINNRSKIYSEADHKIDCEGLSRSEITKEIIKLYEDF